MGTNYNTRRVLYLYPLCSFVWCCQLFAQLRWYLWHVGEPPKLLVSPVPIHDHPLHLCSTDCTCVFEYSLPTDIQYSQVVQHELSSLSSLLGRRGWEEGREPWESATANCTYVKKLFEAGWSCYGNGSDVCGQKHRLFLYLCMCMSEK